MVVAAAGLGSRWFVGVVVLPVCGDFQRRRQHSATTVHRALPVCGWPSLGMPQVVVRSNAASAVLRRNMVEPALGAASGLCRWFVGVLPVCGGVQRRRQHSATKAYRALPMCEWPALGILWGTK